MSDRELGRLLRRGDPAAASPGLGRDERARLRRRLLAEAESARARRGWGRGLLAAASAAAALVMALVWLDRPTPSAVGADEAPVAGPAPEGRSSREIQFVTDGGTLVVWVLDPDFSL